MGSGRTTRDEEGLRQHEHFGDGRDSGATGRERQEEGVPDAPLQDEGVSGDARQDALTDLEWMSGAFGQLFEHSQKLFRQIQLRNRAGFCRALERMRTMIGQVLEEKETDREVKRTCENCVNWNTTGNRATCTGPGSPYEYMHVGAGNSCSQWKPRQ